MLFTEIIFFLANNHSKTFKVSTVFSIFYSVKGILNKFSSIPSAFSAVFGVVLMGSVWRHFVDLNKVPNDVETMRKGSRTVGAAKLTDACAFVAHVSEERMLDLIPNWRWKFTLEVNQDIQPCHSLSIAFIIWTHVMAIYKVLLKIQVIRTSFVSLAPRHSRGIFDLH